jgi:hypothetical protein
VPILRVLVPMGGATMWHVGDLYECDEASAERLVNAGRAEYLPAPSDHETAMVDGAPERAVRPRGRPRKVV